LKKGPAIIVGIGILLLAGVVFMPVTPSSEEEVPVPEVQEESSAAAHTHEDVEAQVQAAVESLSDTTKPPMQAIMSLRSIAEEHPENFSANLTLGLLSMRTAQYENAVMRFNKVLEVAPNNVDTYGFLASAHEALGQKAEARAALEKGISLAQGEEKAQLEAALNELNNN
jgi:Flp pilus assembly protein TadD